MPDFRVPPGCEGLKLEDGSRYEAGRDGRIVVDRPDHAAAIERVGRTGGGHIHRVRVGSPTRTPYTECVPCRFRGYAWQSTCPKCGQPLAAADSLSRSA